MSGCQLSGHGGRGVRIYQNTNTAANNIIFEKNIIRDNHHTVALDLQEGGGTGDVTNVIFRYNRVYDTQTSDADPAIYIDGSSSCDFINLQIYGNLFYDVYGRGIAVQDTQGPVYIYNNTFYRSSSSGYDHIDVESEAGTVSIRNNIFYDTYGYFLNIANASGKSVDYNCYYNTVGTGLNRVGSSTYTTSQWSAYVRATGFDTNGMYSNPYVKSPSTDNFILLSNSPCIDEGMNLGSSYADGIDPDSTWPENVSTLDQNLFGSAWEIGAYVYASDLSGLDITPPAAPSNISTSIQ